MIFPERFAQLPEYPFPRLRRLLNGVAPGGPVIDMTIGAPRHPFPEWVPEVVAEHAAGFGRYPPNAGTPELLEAISGWLSRRYGVAVGPERLMVLNGSREGLFNAALALCPEDKAGRRPFALIPNPFYQVYEAASLAAGAVPVHVPATRETEFLPDYASLSRETLDRTALAWACSPSNPQGAVAPAAWWEELLRLAERHDFRVLADECYSEIWRGAPPPGALEALARTGVDPERLVVFNSLSKRSNLPGLRSGFLAAGSESARRLRQLRAYGGAPCPLPLMRVAERAWSDEAHVVENRARYDAKFALAETVLGDLPGWRTPPGGFFLWLEVGDGETAARALWCRHGVKVLPGAYLARQAEDGTNPGARYIRVALVAEADELHRGLQAIREMLLGGE